MPNFKDVFNRISFLLLSHPFPSCSHSKKSNNDILDVESLPHSQDSTCSNDDDPIYDDDEGKDSSWTPEEHSMSDEETPSQDSVISDVSLINTTIVVNHTNHCTYFLFSFFRKANFCTSLY